MDEENRPLAERVVALETELKAHRREMRGKFTLINRGMNEIRKQLQAQSLNGETQAIKDFARVWADDGFQNGLKAIVADHEQSTQVHAWFRKHWGWLATAALSLPTIVASGFVARFAFEIVPNFWK